MAGMRPLGLILRNQSCFCSLSPMLMGFTVCGYLSSLSAICKQVSLFHACNVHIAIW